MQDFGKLPEMRSHFYYPVIRMDYPTYLKAVSYIKAVRKVNADVMVQYPFQPYLYHVNKRVVVCRTFQRTKSMTKRGYGCMTSIVSVFQNRSCYDKEMTGSDHFAISLSTTAGWNSI